VDARVGVLSGEMNLVTRASEKKVGLLFFRQTKGDLSKQGGEGEKKERVNGLPGLNEYPLEDSQGSKGWTTSKEKNQKNS